MGDRSCSRGSTLRDEARASENECAAPAGPIGTLPGPSSRASTNN